MEGNSQIYKLMNIICLLQLDINTSEWASMFEKLILATARQNIQKAPYIKGLLKRWLQMWRDNLFEQLIKDAELL